MLEHDVWSPGHLTVLHVRARRPREVVQRRHEVEVRRDGVRVAEGDEDGILRSTTGLVLAEALLADGRSGRPASTSSRPGPGVRPASLWLGGTAVHPDERAAPPTATDERPAPPTATDERPAPPTATGAGPAPPIATDGTPAPPTARDVAPAPPPMTAAGPAAVTTTHAAPAPPTVADAGPTAAGLTVDVFGVRQGEVRVTAASERVTERVFRADLVVGGEIAARLCTVGRQAQEVVVVAGDRELARLARFDHLRGVGRTVSSWDLAVAEIEDPRLRAVTVAAVLRLPALRAAASGRAVPVS